jgi:type IV pilus assembly protein PilQ
MPSLPVVLAILAVLAPPLREGRPAAPPGDGEARISMDVKDAPLVDVVRLLAEVGGFQVVFDPGIDCKLTLKLNEVTWPAALDVSLRSCGLGRDEEGGILRIASLKRLTEERAAERKLREEKEANAPRRVSSYRLSYARAQEMAPLVKRLLSPRGEVIYDARTNTLFVID